MNLRHAVTGEVIIPRCTMTNCIKWKVCRLKYEVGQCKNYVREEKELDIRLIKLSAKNFKGIKHFVLDIGGNNASIYADNAVGKTTLFDLFKWILFGKDSSNRAKFKIKPQDSEGNEVHYLQTEGEVELLVDGKALKLRKMLEEDWTTKRGETEKKLTGNTVSYWWDDEPVKESEFTKRVGALVDEKIFMAVTDPMYFNKLDWKERRTILLSMCGEVAESEILANEKFAKLLNILSGKTIEVYKKILAERIALLEKQRKDIPARIDELTQTIPEVAEDYTAIEVEIQRLREELTKIDGEISAANNNAGEYRKQQQKLFSLKSDLQRLKTKLDNEANSGTKDIIDSKNKLENEKYKLESEITTLKSRLGNSDVVIATKNKQKATLLATYKSLNEELANEKAIEFIEPEEGSFICPTCGQGLPEEAREEKINSMRKKFEETKATNIKAIESKITENISSGKLLKEEIETAQDTINKLNEKLTKAESDLKEIQSKIASIVVPEGNIVADYNASEDYCTLQDIILVLETELNKPLEDSTAKLLQDKREIQSKIDNCNSVIGSKEVAEKSKKRIDELKAEEKRLAQEITELKGQEFLIQEFDVAKINASEDKVNSQFKFVKFRMFENQVNGGIAQCCEALVNTNGVWVPYTTNANTAGTINAGVDCINALSSFYKVTAPIWVDNAESVTDIIPSKSQVIRLIKPTIKTPVEKALYQKLVVEIG